MRLPRNVILTGFMGSGKTTVGRRLAARLRWRFVDLDRLVERRAGMPVTEVFRRRGERVFRRIEHRAVRSLARCRRCVIAAGGGVLTYAPNRPLLKAAGLRVWLQVPVAVIARRVRGSSRPLLASARGNPAALRRLIGRLLRTRQPAYASADLTIPAGRGTPSAVADVVLRRLRA